MNATTTLTAAPARSPVGITKGLLLLSPFYVALAVYYVAVFAIGRFLCIQVPPGNSLFFSLLIAWPPTLLIAFKATGISVRHCLRIRAVPAALLMGFGLTIVGMVPVLLSLIALIPVPASIHEAFDDASRGNQALVAVAAVLLAPLAEEMFFRGILLSSFLERYSRTKAVWASAVLFALYHLNPWHALAALAMGLFFAWIVIETHALWPAILAHMLGNLVALKIIPKLFLRLGYSNAYMESMRFYPLPIFTASVLIMACGFALLLRACKQQRIAGRER